MNRSQVYALIDDEREYQLRRHTGMVNSGKPHNDDDWSVADWILFMEEQLVRAKREFYELDEGAAKEHVRKATALGVACMEHHHTVPRLDI